MPEQKSPRNTDPDPYRNPNPNPNTYAYITSSSSSSFARPSLPRPPPLPLPPPSPTRNRFRGHDVEDARRDVPQSLLLPYSLGTTTPGRQVLFRHQMVLRAASAVSPLPPPPPAALLPLKAAGVDPQEEEGGQSFAREPIAVLKVQRCRDRWIDLKRRMKPASYPFAGFLFMVIVLVAAGTVVSGWYGLSRDTINHESEPTPPPSISSRTAEPPAPPDLRLSSHLTPAHGALPEMLGTGQLPEEVPLLSRAVPEDTAITAAAAVANVLLATTTTTNTHVVTTTILVPPPPSSCTTCTDDDHDDGSPHGLPSPRTSTSTSTASPDTSSPISAATLPTTTTAAATSNTDDSARTPTTTSTELPPLSPSSSSDASVMTGLMYCPWPGRPHIYTLCPETHTRAPGMLDPTAGAVSSTSGGAPSAPRPPFVAVVVSALASCLRPLSPLFGGSRANAVLEMEIKMLREQRRAVGQTREVLGLAREVLRQVKARLEGVAKGEDGGAGFVS
ncbi:hypothetical protein F5X96DRAFT_616060 [Biscogniauxia mediterranea]|nr:hypothetical protein F5X96DRAFT_616060 [Biscogniauxia mediterranea]